MDKASKPIIGRKNDRWLSLLPVLLLALWLTLQIFGAQQKSFWEDEAWTATIASGTPADIVRATIEDRHPPLYFLVAEVWIQMFGAEELGLRSLSIIFSAGALVISYIFVRRISGRETATVSIILLVFSPFLLMYGHAARYYGMAAFISMACMDNALQYFDTQRLRYLVFYTLTGLALLYTAYIGAGVLIACNLWWLASIRSKKSTWLRWLGAQGVILAAFLPWAPNLGAQMQTGFQVSGQSTNWLLEIVKRAGYLGYTFGLGETMSPLKPIAWAGMLALAGMAVAALVFNRGVRRLPLVVFLCVAALSIGISLVSVYPVGGWQGIPNRMFLGLPFFIIWLSGWVSPGKNKFLYLLPVFLLCANIIAGINYFFEREYFKPFLNVPWREIMTNIQESTTGTGAVVCGPGDYACGYYVKRYGFDFYAPAGWSEVEKKEYSDAWWVRNNLGEPTQVPGGEGETIALASGVYSLAGTANYAAQDESIRWLKTNILGQQDYEYRVNLYHFVRTIRMVDFSDIVRADRASAP